jgi:hypothetical protein
MVIVFAVIMILGSWVSGGWGLEEGEFDPAGWDTLLRQYVTDGLVDYKTWQREGIEALDAFLDAAGEYDLTSTMGKEPKAAFLVNVYNAWAVRQILDHYPVDSVQEIPGFFDKNKRLVAEERLTLDDIEEKLATLLRHNPDFAFLLVPGTSGWPRLTRTAYSTENYREGVREAGRALVDEKLISLDREAKVLRLPVQITKYDEIYENMPQGLVGVLSDYLPLADIVAIGSKKPEHATGPVDWSLNDSAPEAKGRDAQDENK